ncbi:IS5 family transposase [Leptothermofonsia sichuanensis E412]|uniref:IS5 family transposase n=1 Tax=Leptothermofonsia sichuanensis TaxID=2917832 RepID=UPI001CA71255|nr:IS5 family transposase [Leptothermofonsia sichuanensis]QZZ22614.1 IS5 family transposase [Leptothermofonsia sichuanensis E412]
MRSTIKGGSSPREAVLCSRHVQRPAASGRSQAGFSTKIHLRWDGNGLSITCLLSVGECHEVVVLEQLMEHGAVKRGGAGRPRLRPKRVSGDQGYSSGKIRRYLRRRGIRITISRKDNQRHRGRFDKALYRQRKQIERSFNPLKQFRPIAIRYEKQAENYLAMLTIASIILCLIVLKQTLAIL